MNTTHEFKPPSINNSFDDSLEEGNNPRARSSPAKDNRRTSILKASMKEVVEMVSRTSKQDVTLHKPDKPYQQEYWKKKLVFKRNDDHFSDVPTYYLFVK